MKESILVCGYGGQGVVLAGSLLANSGMEQGLEVSGMVSYGVEMRGGTCNSNIIISDKVISSPVIIAPNTMIVMNQQSLDKFENSVEKGGTIIINASDCKRKVERDDVKVIEVEATDIAKELGNIKATNMVMVGAYIKYKGIIDIEIVKKMLTAVLPRASEQLIELNKEALMKGYGED